MIGLDGIGFHAIGEMFLGTGDIGYMPVSKVTGYTLLKFKTRDDYPIPVVPPVSDPILWDDDTSILWDNDSEILFDN